MKLFLNQGLLRQRCVIFCHILRWGLWGTHSEPSAVGSLVLVAGQDAQEDVEPCVILKYCIQPLPQVQIIYRWIKVLACSWQTRNLSQENAIYWLQCVHALEWHSTDEKHFSRNLFFKWIFVLIFLLHKKDWLHMYILSAQEIRQ